MEKRVSFGKNHTIVIPNRDDEGLIYVKSPTESIRCVVDHMRSILTVVLRDMYVGTSVKNTTTSFHRLSLPQRSLISMDHLEPLVTSLVNHPRITHLVTNVKRDSDGKNVIKDLKDPINQILTDFINIMIENFEENSSIIFVQEDYREHCEDINCRYDNKLHMMVNGSSDTKYFEQCISIRVIDRIDNIPINFTTSIPS